MEAVVILVTELELPPFNVDQLHFVGRAEPHVGAFPGVDVANDCLDKGTQIPRRSMLHFEDNGRVAVVLYCHSFTKIVRCGHLGESLNN